jgi:ribose-phosphate pyrophosphokinase
LFAEHVASNLSGPDVIVVSPDPGGVKRAEHFRQILSDKLDAEIPFASLEKQRSEGVVRGQTLLGDVHGRTAIIFDDLISTGTTLARAATTCRTHGADGVWAAATHGLFTGDAAEVLSEPALDKILVTNTVPARRLSPSHLHAKVVVLDISPLIATTVHRLHTDASIVELATSA